jgi:hypothetical protein
VAVSLFLVIDVLAYTVEEYAGCALPDVLEGGLETLDFGFVVVGLVYAVEPLLEAAVFSCDALELKVVVDGGDDLVPDDTLVPPEARGGP